MRQRGPRDPHAPGDPVLVELVESDDAGARSWPGARETPGGPTNPDATDATDAPRRRGLWWTGAAVLAVLALVVMVTNVVEARREAERRAAFAELTWVLPALDGPLEEVWRAPGLLVVEATSDVIVVQDVAGGMRGVDAVTGAEVWALDFAVSGYCSAVSSWWSYATEPEEAGDPVLLCQSPSEVGADTGGWQSVELRTIDARTGERLADLSVDGVLISAALADDDLVLVMTRPDDTVLVDRTDLRTGERQWRYEGEPGSGDSNFTDSFSIEVTDTAVLVDGTQDLVLSVETGEMLPDDPGPSADGDPDLRLELDDGGVVEWSYDRSDGMNGAGRVLNEDGSVRFTFEGDPEQPYANDGAQSVLVIRHSSADGSTGTTTALDITTGETLWSEPSDWGTTELLELGGRVLRTSDVARMLDERTGLELWRTEVDAAVSMYAPVTDGRVVVLPVHDDGLQLVALDLANGEERWRVPGPTGATALSATADGLVLVLTSSEVVAYRP